MLRAVRVLAAAYCFMLCASSQVKISESDMNALRQALATADPSAIMRRLGLNPKDRPYYVRDHASRLISFAFSQGTFAVFIAVHVLVGVLCFAFKPARDWRVVASVAKLRLRCPTGELLGDGGAAWAAGTSRRVCVRAWHDGWRVWARVRGMVLAWV